MSEIRANTISDAAGTGPVELTAQWAVKAFMNYDQTTPVVGKAGNVSSVTDNSVGNWTMNFTTSMDSAAYAVSGQSGNAGTSTSGVGMRPVTLAASSLRCISTVNSAGADSYVDYADTSCAVIGDLA